VIFSDFWSFLCSVLRVLLKTDPRRRDRFVSVPVESATEIATLNHGNYKLMIFKLVWINFCIN